MSSTDSEDETHVIKRAEDLEPAPAAEYDDDDDGDDDDEDEEEGEVEGVNPVDLGFVEDCDHRLLTSAHFPSKVGGAPAWLDVEHVPTAEDLACGTCGHVLAFLLQVHTYWRYIRWQSHSPLVWLFCRCTPGGAGKQRIASIGLSMSSYA